MIFFKSVFLGCFFLSLCNVSFCQDDDRIEADRPDQTETPSTVTKNHFQAEFGFNYEKEDNETTLVHPTVLWKYGILKKMELRLITEYITQKTASEGVSTSVTGLSPVQIGFKFRFVEEKGALPKTSLLVHVAPSFLASSPFKTPLWAPDIKLSMQHTLSKILSLGYNIGVTWDGVDKNPSWVYTDTWGINIGKNGYGYAEIFGGIQRFQKPDHNLGTGLAYFISNDMLIDISASKSIVEKNKWYSAIGFSVRL